jgi:hypothetical protein
MKDDVRLEEQTYDAERTKKRESLSRMALKAGATINEVEHRLLVANNLSHAERARAIGRLRASQARLGW